MSGVARHIVSETAAHVTGKGCGVGSDTLNTLII
jgi:hypothetical protein